MSERDMWKMLHLLNNTGRPSLTTQELRDAGVDCYKDTLEELKNRGGVKRFQDAGTERWELADGASGVLNTCSVARKLKGAGEVQVDRSEVFCVMPFSEDWSNDVWKCIKWAAKKADLRRVRGDTTLRTGELVENVWNKILSCGCVVAELTAPNTNVYYELGLAHALGRDTFVMVQKGTDLPADLKGKLYLEYDLDDLKSAKKELRDQLLAWKDHEDVRADGVKALFQAPPSVS